MKRALLRAGFDSRSKAATRSGWAVVTICALSGAALAAPAAAAEGDYTFTKVLDSADGYDPFSFGCAAINSRGDVVTKADRVNPDDEFDTVEVVERVNAAGAVTTIIDEDAADLRRLGRNPKINDSGQVSSWAAGPGSRNEFILRGRGGPLTVIAGTRPRAGQQPVAFDNFAVDTTINNEGTVAFRGEVLADGDEGLWSGNGGALTTHYLASEGRFGGLNAGVSINNDGQIAFEERSEGQNGIFRGANGDFVTIASEPDRFFEEPSINESGTVAFYGEEFTEDFEQVFSVLTGSGGPLTTVADTTGPFSFFGFRGPAINNDGDVAFFAELDSNEFPPPGGIFTGPDPVADRVIGTGDTLDGDTITSLTFCESALSNSGQLAFTAFFEDPDTFELRTAVFRATPVTP
jgi:hypothetical protein